MKISELKSNPNNPRVLRDEKFKKLVKSIQEFPKMMELRPIIIDADNVVLGGNMRLKALQELKYKDVPDTWVKRADQLTEDEKKRFIITDNVGFGEWDWDILANEWEVEQLNDWGLDLPEWGNDSEEKNTEINENYTSKIKAPVYEVKNEKPPVLELYDIEKTKQLIDEIDKAPINAEDKQFLKIAAARHTVFNYEKIADFYAHSSKEVQELMENSALIIIDFNKAIENGFVKLSSEIENQFLNEYQNE